MKNKILLGTVAFVAVLAVIGLLAVSFTMTPVLATNATNVTEKINVTCTTAIAVPDSSIDVGAGYIPQSCIDCWIGQNTTSCEDLTSLWNDPTAVTVINTKSFSDLCWVNTTAMSMPDTIQIKNKGNNFISLSINLLSDDDWLLQTGGAEFGDNGLEVFLEQGSATPGSNDDAAACIDGMINGENEATLALSTPTEICGALAWEDNRNEVYLADKFLINPKTEPKQYVLTKEISAAEVQCGGAYVPDTPSPPSIVMTKPATTDIPNPPVPGPIALDGGSWGNWRVVGTPYLDAASTLSSPFAIAGYGGEFAITGVNFGSVDFSGSDFILRTFDPMATPGTEFATAPVTFTGLTPPIPDFDMDISSGGGTSVTVVNGGMYLLVGNNGATTPAEGSLLAAGGTIGAGFIGPSTPIGNVCTALGVTCAASPVFPAAVFDMGKADNANPANPNAILGVVFSSNAAGEKFGVLAVDGAVTQVTAPFVIPGFGNADVVANAAYTPLGELCLWKTTIPMVNGATDAVKCFIAIRNGNAINALLPIADFPTGTLGAAHDIPSFGLAFDTPNMPPGISASVGPFGS